MFNKQEAGILKQQFWTRFGQYMAPVPSAEGLKINWINYKTGVKDLQFTIQANNHHAVIAIMLVHADVARQAAIFKQFEKWRHLLRDALQEEWQWEMQVTDENNKTISRIYTQLNGVSLYRQQDWPAIISFFKPRLIALDQFWSEVKYAFEV